MALKSRENVLLFYLYSKDSAFTAVKGIQSYKQGMWEGYHFSIEGIWKEPSTFSVKNGIQKGKGLDLGVEPPRLTLCSGGGGGGGGGGGPRGGASPYNHLLGTPPPPPD